MGDINVFFMLCILYAHKMAEGAHKMAEGEKKTKGIYNIIIFRHF